MKKLTIEDKLGKDKFVVDEDHSHITVDKEYLDRSAMEQLCRACPAGLYKIDQDGNLQFSYLGCLECGTCRVLSLGKVVKDWDYPMGGFGVSYRMS